MKKSSKNGKTYEKPRLIKHGSVKDLTKDVSNGSTGDTGTKPKMMCISAPPAIDEHRILFADKLAQDAYRKALKRAIKPGHVVVDLGSGSGLHTLFALEAGAKKVYAIESEPIIDVAREVIEANGYGDRVEFIRGDSRLVELPEKADVVVSNIGFLYSLKCLPNAMRFLKSGGRMIPSGVQMGIGLYEDPTFFNKHISTWDKKHFGFKFDHLKKLASHHPHYLSLSAKKFITKPSLLPEVQFAAWDGSALRYEFTVKAARNGVVHGLAGWYRFLDGKQVLFSTEPPLKLNPELWNGFILPLNEGVAVKKGQTVSFSVGMDTYVLPQSALWNWTVTVAGREAIHHSNFDAMHV